MEYFAFISYQRNDEKWAEWLAYELEHYHLPISLNGRKDMPKDLRPIFRDLDELSAGNLPQQIKKALYESKYLIVICSPDSARSPWVNNELSEFIAMGRTDRIFPFIIDGIAMCKKPDDPRECFPPALRNLPKENERLGANIKEKGRDAAVVKIVAGMLGLGFNALWNRYEREKAEEERKIREQRDNLLRLQSRYLSEKANALVDEGDSYTARLLALEALPKDPDNPDRPYIPAAESALRNALRHESAIFRSEYFLYHMITDTEGRFIFVSYADYDSAKYGIYCISSDTCRIVQDFTGYDDSITSICISSDSRLMAASDRNKVLIWDIMTGEVINQFIKSDCIITGIAISFDNKRLAISTEDVYYDNHDENTTSIYEINTGKRLLSLGWFKGNDSAIAFTPDDKFIITQGKGNLEIWNALTGGRKRKISSYLSAVSHDGNAVAIINNKTKGEFLEGKIQIYDFNSLRPIHTLSIKDTHPHRLCFSNDSKELAIYYIEGVIRIWDYKYETITEVMCPASHKVYDICFCDSDEKLAILMEDKSIRIIEIETGFGSCCRLDLEKRIFRYSFNPDRSLLCISSWDYTKIFCLKDRQTVSIDNLPETDTSAAFSNNGEYIAVSSSPHLHYEKSIVIMKASTGAIVNRLDMGEFSTSSDCEHSLIAWSHDDKMIAAGIGHYEIIIWDILSREYISVEESDYFLALEFSKDSRTLMSLTEEGSLKLWDATTGHCFKTYPFMKYGKMSFAILSPDSCSIAAGSMGELRIWEIESDKMVFESPQYIGQIRSIVFSSDQKYIAAGYGGTIYQMSTDNAIRIFSIDTGTCIMEITEISDTVIDLSFDSDDKYITALTDKGEILTYPFERLQDIIDHTRKRFIGRHFNSEEMLRYGL